MANDSVTLRLEGDVRLDDLWRALQRLSDLLAALAAEVCPGSGVAWMVDALDAGSASVTVRGQAQRDDDSGDGEADVARVVDALGRLGAALEAGDLGGRSQAVRAAAALVAGIDRRVPALRLRTLAGEHILASATVEPRHASLTRALGSIEGTVESLSQRGAGSFVLRDAIFFRAVRCFLSPGQEDWVRDAWGKRVSVSGVIWREPENGRAIQITEISEIEEHALYEPSDLRTYAGILRESVLDEPPEDTIRRMRDDG